MKIVRLMSAPVSIEEFADRYHLVMAVGERYSTTLPRFYAFFQDVEVADGGFLVSTFGHGRTESEAIENYAKLISGKVLVSRSYQKERREIVAPPLYYAPPPPES